MMANPSIFARRYWPDGPPTASLPAPETWVTLPTVSVLRSPAIASIRLDHTIYDVGWNGCWAKAFACAHPDAPVHG